MGFVGGIVLLSHLTKLNLTLTPNPEEIKKKRPDMFDMKSSMLIVAI